MIWFQVFMWHALPVDVFRKHQSIPKQINDLICIRHKAAKCETCQRASKCRKVEINFWGFQSKSEMDKKNKYQQQQQPKPVAFWHNEHVCTRKMGQTQQIPCRSQNSVQYLSIWFYITIYMDQSYCMFVNINMDKNRNMDRDKYRNIDEYGYG